jgi:tRNA 2-selenouridine synthase SelU
MRSAAVILLESSIETRVERTVEEYIVQQPHSLPVIRQTIEKLARDLGKKSVSTLLDNFDQGDYQRCFQRILEKYYDRKYSHSMRGLTYERVVSSEELDVAVREIEGFRLISSAAG